MPCMFRFVGVAARWAAALLDQADQERQGVDLFGRDALVLGHVLATLVRCPGCPARPASCDPTGACIANCCQGQKPLGLSLTLPPGLASTQQITEYSWLGSSRRVFAQLVVVQQWAVWAACTSKSLNAPGSAGHLCGVRQPGRRHAVAGLGRAGAGGRQGGARSQPAVRAPCRPHSILAGMPQPIRPAGLSCRDFVCASPHGYVARPRMLVLSLYAFK